MATSILDSLVVTFAIDGKKAVEGAKDVEKAVDSLTDSAQEGGAAAEDAAKSTERAFQRTDQAMRRTGGTLQETRRIVEGNNRAIDGSGRSIVETGRKVVKTTEGTNKAIDRSREKNVRNAKDMGASQERLAETLGKVRGEAVSLLAIFTAGRGMKEFLSSTTATSAAAGRMAHNLGMSTQDLTAWQTVAKESGGTAEGMTSSLQGLVDQFQTITGRTKLSQAFSYIGVNLEDGNHKLRDRTQIMMDLADKFSSMDPTQANTWGQMLGFDQGTINTLERGRKALSGLYDEARKYGVTPEQAAAFAQIQQDWEHLTNQSNALGRSILTNLAPAFHTILADTSEFIDKNGPLVEKIGEVTAGAGALATVLGTIASIKFGGRLLGLLGSTCTCGEGGGSVAREVAKDTAKTGGGGAVRAVEGGAPGLIANPLTATIVGAGVAAYVDYQANKGVLYDGQHADESTIWGKVNNRTAPVRRVLIDGIGAMGGLDVESIAAGKGRATPDMLNRAAHLSGWLTNQQNSDLGLSGQAADGVTAAGLAESKLNILEKNPTSSARGAYQFIQSTRDAILKEQGVDVWRAGLGEQARAALLYYRRHNPKRYAEFSRSTSSASAMAMFTKDFLAPGDGYAGDISRGKGYLQQMQPMLQHAAGPTNNSTSNTQTIHVDAITVNTHGANPDSVVRAIHHEFGVAATLGHQTATRLG